jgi:hypothetical protein
MAKKKLKTKNLCRTCGAAAAQGVDDEGNEGALHCKKHPRAAIDTVVVTRGRPVGSGNDLVEASVLVTGPAELLSSVRAAAEREGVPVREWWRRAAKSRLEGKLPEGKR